MLNLKGIKLRFTQSAPLLVKLFKNIEFHNYYYCKQCKLKSVLVILFKNVLRLFETIPNNIKLTAASLRNLSALEGSISM